MIINLLAIRIPAMLIAFSGLLKLTGNAGGTGEMSQSGSDVIFDFPVRWKLYSRRCLSCRSR